MSGRAAGRMPRGLLRADARRSRLRGGGRRRRVSRRPRRGGAGGVRDRLPLTWTRIEHAGRSAAKNLAVLLAPRRARAVLRRRRLARAATCWTSTSAPTSATRRGDRGPRLHRLGAGTRGHAADALPDRRRPAALLLRSFETGQRIDWRGFWEGRVSSKRSLHLRHGLHDQRLDYSIDVEMAWRLRATASRSSTTPAARSFMARPIDFEEFCRRIEAKGRAQAAIAPLHDDPEIREYTKVEDAVDAGRRRGRARRRDRGIEQVAAELEARSRLGRRPWRELHRRYREAFTAATPRASRRMLHGASPRAVRRTTGGRPPAEPVSPNGRRPRLHGGDTGRWRRVPS